MEPQTFVLPGWVVVLLIGAVPTLLATIWALVISQIKERKYKALIEDLRAEFTQADTTERHNMRNEIAPSKMQAGMHRMNWNQFLAMRHPDLMAQFTVKEIPDE